MTENHNGRKIPLPSGRASQKVLLDQGALSGW